MSNQDECYLCGGIGEVETHTTDSVLVSVPCPECIAVELQEERAEELNKIKDLAMTAAAYLNQAAEDVADWGAYASEYFQEKHNLSFDIKLYQQRSNEFLAIAEGRASNIAAAQQGGNS
ncbi:hypothetical protein [Pseudohongiella nitratireducens]|uniref:hypothetical protein n=1 Tax=Pseudohongiella nitratireducens TaxID=1768907 RepID=UPI0030EB2B6A|tara:strand:+ start:3982 stop:4338 length:357 start_codon:yes stop_codon:yes gene_type:complete